MPIKIELRNKPPTRRKEKKAEKKKAETKLRKDAAEEQKRLKTISDLLKGSKILPKQGTPSLTPYKPKKNPIKSKKGAAGGPIPKSKPVKAPPGTKVGPGRKDKKGVPHGVDDDTIFLKEGGSASKFGMLSVKAGVDNNPNPTQADSIGRGVIKKKRGGDVHPPKKKRGNYGPNIGKPFKAMGPVGGLPVNKAGTKIMAGAGKLAGRLAKRGYGKAKK